MGKEGGGRLLDRNLEVGCLLREVTTGNSRMKQAEIDAFAKRGEAPAAASPATASCAAAASLDKTNREELLNSVQAEMKALK